MWRTVVLLLAAISQPARADELPLIDEVEWAPFRRHCLGLLDGVEKLKGAVPSETVKAVRALLAKEPDNPRLAARAVQKLLDAHCLAGVNINPESRVKVARGPRRAELVRDQAIYVLVKVHNQGGVTHPLAVASEQAVEPGKKDPDRWVEAAVMNEKPFANQLTGHSVEYRVLRLTARQAGRREATFSFDVGQGTQDLGFRAEVPILFTVRPR
jgi:hypothetical protein